MVEHERIRCRHPHFVSQPTKLKLLGVYFQNTNLKTLLSQSQFIKYRLFSSFERI